MSLPLSGTSWESCMHLAALTGSGSTWTKFSLLSAHKRLSSSTSLTMKERRQLSVCRLLAIALVLKVVRSKASASSTLSSPYALRAMLFLAATSLLGKALQSWKAAAQNKQRRWVCVGRPAPAGKTDADCVICQGVGVDDWQPTAKNVSSSTPQLSSKVLSHGHSRSSSISSSTDSQSSSDDDLDNFSHDDGTDGDHRLESFCASSHHVAHRACMRAWWLSQSKDTPSSPDANTNGSESFWGSFTFGGFILQGGTDVELPTTTPVARFNSHKVQCPTCRRRVKFTARPSQPISDAADYFAGRLQQIAN